MARESWVVLATGLGVGVWVMAASGLRGWILWAAGAFFAAGSAAAAWYVGRHEHE